MSGATATAYVALGANLDDPVRQVRGALAALAALPESRLDASSPLYRTAPVGVRGQPDFINAVARVVTRLSPPALLSALFAIEARFGRHRELPLSPRTLDLDLLLYDDLIASFSGPPQLILPHPRLHLRAFVIVPLLAIAPDIAVPGRGSARAWLPAVANQTVALAA